MIKAENKVIEAFASPAGQIIATFLNGCRDEMIERLIVSDGDDFKRSQGAIQELKEISKLAINARNILHS